MGKIDYSIITPVKVDSWFDDIYFTFYDEKVDKRKQIIRKYKNWFYHSDIKKPILKADCAERIFPESAIYMKREAGNYSISYEGDLSLSRRFLSEKFGKLDMIKKATLRYAFLDIEVDIVKIEDLGEIVNRGVMMTPAIFIDGEVKIVGRVPSVDELKELLGK